MWKRKLSAPAAESAVWACNVEAAKRARAACGTAMMAEAPCGAVVVGRQEAMEIQKMHGLCRRYDVGTSSDCCSAASAQLLQKLRHEAAEGTGII